MASNSLRWDGIKMVKWNETAMGFYHLLYDLLLLVSQKIKRKILVAEARAYGYGAYLDTMWSQVLSHWMTVWASIFYLGHPKPCKLIISRNYVEANTHTCTQMYIPTYMDMYVCVHAYLSTFSPSVSLCKKLWAK